MKVFRLLMLGIVIGLLLGLWFGVNIGREMPLLSNPFHQESVADKLKRLSGETLEKSGKALEKTGQELQDKLK